jgi:hypothetical protein
MTIRTTTAVDAIAEVLAERASSAPREVARAVVTRLLAPDILDAMGDALHDALTSAHDAAIERPDLFESPGNSRVAAEVAVGAIVDVLDQPEVDQQPPERLAPLIAGLSYRDGWRFRMIRLPDGRSAVSVRAAIDDTYHPGSPFETTRIAAIHGNDVVGAAYRAVMQIEGHEARERLRLHGRAVLDPHSADNVQPPRNHKPT